MLKTTKFTLMLVLTACVIVPFGNDLYISALPLISKAFVTNKAPLVLTTFLFGLAFSQLFYGPLLDRFGRKPVLLCGLIIFIIASAAVIFSSTFNFLLVARFFQAIGACSTIVAVLAIIRDVYPQEKIVHATSMIMAIIGICPAIAPLLGSALTKLWGWQASFIFLLYLGIFFLLVVIFLFKETQHQKNLMAMKLKPMINNYYNLLTNKMYLNYCLVSTFSYGALFSVYALSPLFILQKFGFGLLTFGVLIALNSIAIILTALIIPRLSKRVGLDRILLVGASIISLGGMSMWLSNQFLINSIYTFMIPMFVTTLGVGMIRPTASGGAMSVIPSSIAGSAAAGFSFTSFIGGAFSTLFAAVFIHQINTLGIFIIVFGLSACMIIAKVLIKNINNADLTLLT